RRGFEQGLVDDGLVAKAAPFRLLLRPRHDTRVKPDGHRRVLQIALGWAATARALLAQLLFDGRSGCSDLSRGNPPGGFKRELFCFWHTAHAPFDWPAAH